jgi:hypothetical protein
MILDHEMEAPDHGSYIPGAGKFAGGHRWPLLATTDYRRPLADVEGCCVPAAMRLDTGAASHQRLPWDRTVSSSPRSSTGAYWRQLANGENNWICSRSTSSGLPGRMGRRRGPIVSLIIHQIIHAPICFAVAVTKVSSPQTAKYES